MQRSAYFLAVLLLAASHPEKFDAAPAGQINIRVENPDGAPLRGATVTLSLADGGEPQIVITDGQGEAHFRDLHEGSRYKADCSIAGTIPVTVGPVLVDVGPTVPLLPAKIRVIMNPQLVF